jgi:cytochrome c oxidase subunit IV
MVDRDQHIPPVQSTDPREIRSSELLEHGHISVRTYTAVFIALMVLLAITVAAAQIPFGERGVGPLGVLITFLIATVKAVLVVVYFMHIRYSTRLTRVFVVAGLLWLGILFALTLNDYLTRGWLPLSSGWDTTPAIPRPPPPDLTADQ